VFALISLVVCLAAQPLVCETVTPDYAHLDTGRPPTFLSAWALLARTSHASGSPSTPTTCYAASNAPSPAIRGACGTRSKAPKPDEATAGECCPDGCSANNVRPLRAARRHLAGLRKPRLVSGRTACTVIPPGSLILDLAQHALPASLGGRSFSVAVSILHNRRYHRSREGSRCRWPRSGARGLRVFHSHGVGYETCRLGDTRDAALDHLAQTLVGQRSSRCRVGLSSQSRRRVGPVSSRSPGWPQGGSQSHMIAIGRQDGVARLARQPCHTLLHDSLY
jgi:hypothetical protein